MTANKFTTAFLLGAASLIAACQPNQKNETPTPQTAGMALFDSAVAYAPTCITIDSANKMLNSYLASVNATTAGADTNLFSLIVNADSLRAYLNNTNIKHVKLMFAHKLSYINAGNYGRNAGYSNKALTLIIAGFGNNGNYIYTTSGQVMDNLSPCPTNCPTSGSASYNTLSQ